MPLNLSREDRRLLIVASTVFLASAVLAIVLSPTASEADFASSYSAASQGAKATYLMLHESGYRVEGWTQPPAHLKDARNTLLIIADPTETPSAADKAALDRFLNDGGELLFAGNFTGFFVWERSPSPLPISAGWAKFAAEAPSPEALNAPEIEIDASASWRKPGEGIGLYGDDDQYAVMQYPHGKGSILWLASSSLLSNAGLRESGNLAFLLSTVGGKTRQVLWDEYFHGHHSTTSAAASHPQVFWMFGQMGFIAVAVLLTYSRRSLPQRAPRAESRLSPLEYVRALGQLYQHARAANVAVDVGYERFRYALIKRLGFRPSISNDELAQAVADRWALDRDDLRSLLGSCESARFFEDLPEREALELVQRLHKYSVLLKLFPDSREEER